MSASPRSVAFALALAISLQAISCSPRGDAASRQRTSMMRPSPQSTDAEQAARLAMVERQIAARGVRDERVLEAMRSVPRHLFVPEEVRFAAYEDRPLPIGWRQTISQPYIVAAMTELARIGPDSRVLEIGTGSGYQAAVLSRLAAEVYSIEIVGELASRARETLEALGYVDTKVRHGDGYAGWPEAAPFDAIVVTAAPPEVPPALLAQLALGGRLVIPVGRFMQRLEVHGRTESGIEREVVFDVRFVPMVEEVVEGTGPE